MDMIEAFNEDPVDVEAMHADAGDKFLVVGLGASAGGVQALRSFFSHVPADTNMAYVVILHLSPDHDSQLAEVLQGASLLPVTKVERRTRLEPDHVYVIPPNKSLEIKNGHIVVLNITSHEVRRAPVDILFRSLAQSHGPRAVSVVLSGTGANGSMGMKRVKEMGGICILYKGCSDDECLTDDCARTIRTIRTRRRREGALLPNGLSRRTERHVAGHSGTQLL